MNVSEHAKILKAYIDKMSMKDLKDILYHKESCFEEHLHGTDASQKSADVILYASILNIIGNMMPVAREHIDSTIDKTLNRKG
jgi:hypothetical protein